MKVIDLLSKIANGEELPKKVEYSGVIFENKDGDLLNDLNCSLFEHRCDGGEKLLPMLNEEVEIIEEHKIPEKIPYHFSLDYIYCNINETAKEEINKTINHIYDKINEIIDYLNKKESE